jgi:hypothetical protein
MLTFNRKNYGGFGLVRRFSFMVVAAVMGYC